MPGDRERSFVFTSASGRPTGTQRKSRKGTTMMKKESFTGAGERTYLGQAKSANSEV